MAGLMRRLECTGAPEHLSLRLCLHMDDDATLFQPKWLVEHQASLIRGAAMMTEQLGFDPHPTEVLLNPEVLALLDPAAQRLGAALKSRMSADRSPGVQNACPPAKKSREEEGPKMPPPNDTSRKRELNLRARLKVPESWTTASSHSSSSSSSSGPVVIRRRLQGKTTANWNVKDPYPAVMEENGEAQRHAPIPRALWPNGSLKLPNDHCSDDSTDRELAPVLEQIQRDEDLKANLKQSSSDEELDDDALQAALLESLGSVES